MSQRGRVTFSDEQSYHFLIDYFQEEYLIERALDVVEYALQEYPRSFGFHIRKAQLLIDIQHEEMAMAALDEAEALAPVELEIPLLRAEVLTSLELYDEALSLLEALKLTESGKELSDVYLAESLVYESMGSYEQMFCALVSSLKEDPNNASALERMWLCVELSKKFRESITLHEEILEINPYSYLAWYNLGAAHAYYGNYDEAIEAYEYAFLINDRFELAYKDCAEICFEIQKYNKALQCYQDVLEHFEPDAYLFQRIGQCYQKLASYAIAKTFFEKAAQLDPFNDEVFFHLGECYLMEENWRKAMLHFKHAIRIEDRREEYYAAMAEACFHAGQLRKVEPLYQKATEIAPEQTEYWMKHIRFLMDMGQFDRALEVINEGEENTGDPNLSYFRIACYFLMGNRKEACFLLTSALDEDFHQHKALFELVPALKEDAEVQAIIATYQPYH